MHVLVKENTILKNWIDELNGKQEDNEKVMKIHKEINAGRRHKNKWKVKEKTWKIIKKKKKQESQRKVLEDQTFEK